METVIGKLPPVATSDARIAAVSCVELTNDVARSEPANRTVDPETKLVPFTVRVKAPLLRSLDDGERPEIVGIGFVGDVATTPFVRVSVPPLAAVEQPSSE